MLCISCEDHLDLSSDDRPWSDKVIRLKSDSMGLVGDREPMVGTKISIGRNGVQEDWIVAERLMHRIRPPSAELAAGRVVWKVRVRNSASPPDHRIVFYDSDDSTYRNFPAETSYRITEARP